VFCLPAEHLLHVGHCVPPLLGKVEMIISRAETKGPLCTLKYFFSYLNTLMKERKNDTEPHKEE
jgi:hypothetical protein